MSLPSWPRVLPALIVIELLALAATAPRPDAVGTAPPPQFYAPCDSFIYAGTGDIGLAMPPVVGIAQPLPAGISAVSCSVRVTTPYLNGQAMGVVEEWDPTTLAPDPQSVALRIQFFDPSSFVYYGGNARRMLLVPPVVTRSVPGVADPPRLTTAFEFVTQYLVSSLTAFFAPSGDPRMPAGHVLLSDGSRTPLPGTHAVFAHALCSGDADLEQLRIAQSVMHADTVLALGTDGYAQRFRVPQAVELRWIELAMNGYPYSSVPTGADTVPSPRMPLRYPIVAVLDGASLSGPVGTMPPSLVESAINIYVNTDRAVWVSSVDFDHTVTLQPNHDYWLYVRDAAAGSLRFRFAHRGDLQSPESQKGIGPCFTRDTTPVNWQEQPDLALSFRLVGRPVPVLAPPPAPQPGDLRLRVNPNPARDGIHAGWSGAVGPVRLELYDARGRRIATGSGGAAGSWQFAPGSRDGHPLPSGVYFVHARDTAGGHVVQRVVLLR